MTRVIDTVIAFRILRMLTTPFNETDAFRLGIIDTKGKELKRMNQLNTTEEQNAYTILHRMIFRIKKIIEKVPLENKKLVSFAAALALVKENLEIANEPINLELMLLEKMDSDLTEEIEFISKFINNFHILPFKLFIEEAPANNAVATPGIDGFTPDTVGVKRKRKKPLILRRNEV